MGGRYPKSNYSPFTVIKSLILLTVLGSLWIASVLMRFNAR